MQSSGNQLRQVLVGLDRTLDPPMVLSYPYLLSQEELLRFRRIERMIRLFVGKLSSVEQLLLGEYLSFLQLFEVLPSGLR
jgi:hypothetical protein